MSICSSLAAQVQVPGCEILNTRFHGKGVQVALAWSLLGIERAFPPQSAVSHMLYLSEAAAIAEDVTQALDFATAGDCVVLLCANQAVASGVRSFLGPLS